MIELFCKKMPISCLLRGLLERCFSAERLDELFERNVQEQYTRNLLFSTACDLLLLTVLRVHPSIHAAYQAREDGQGVSATALYDKLKGVETGVVRALVKDTAQDLREIQDALGVQREPWLPGYDIRILDGNCLEASEKRLGVLRGVGSAALPGKSLVVMDPQRRLLVDVFPCEDGHAQERSLLRAVLETILAGQLWVADRNFCTCGFLGGIHERGAYGLLRLHGGLPFTELTAFGDAVEMESGQRVREQTIEVEGRRYRRIRVALAEPTRDGDLFIDLVTDLPETVSADTLAALYRKRWTLETAFQHIEKHFESEINTLAYPRAALFGFCLALVAYNIFQVALTAIDSANPEPVSQTISTYYVGQEIAATFLALLMLTETGDWRFLSKLSPAEFAQWLREVASGVNPKKYKKHGRGPKKPQQKAPYDPKHPHVSTQRLLQGQRNKMDGQQVG
jgi:hypothetical protein